MKFITTVTSRAFKLFLAIMAYKSLKARDSVNLIFMKMKFHTTSAFWPTFSLKIT